MTAIGFNKLYKNNNTGFDGIHWDHRVINNNSYTNAVATWYEDSCKQTKRFSVRKFGIMEALKRAINHRDKMLIGKLDQYILGMYKETNKRS